MKFSPFLFFPPLAVSASPLSPPATPSIRGVWSPLPPVSSGLAIQEHGTALLNDTFLYLVGGIPATASNHGSAVPSLDTVHVYSTRDRRWLDGRGKSHSKKYNDNDVGEERIKKTTMKMIPPPLPIPMTHANAVAVRGRLYVLGGLTGVAGPENGYLWTAVGDCFVWDPAAESRSSSPGGEWETLPSMGDGGGDDDGTSNDNGNDNNNNNSNPPRGASALGVVDDRFVLVAGGMRSLKLIPGGLQDSVDAVSVFDVETRTWLSGGGVLPKLPAPRDHVGGVVVVDDVDDEDDGDDDDDDAAARTERNGRSSGSTTFFVVGGRNDTRVAGTTYALRIPPGYLQDLVASSYSSSGSSSPSSSSATNGSSSLLSENLPPLRWEARTPMPTPRGGLSVGLVTLSSSAPPPCSSSSSSPFGHRHGRHRHPRPFIVAFGGEGNPAPGSDGVYDETEAYDVRGDRWVSLGKMPVPRHGTIAASSFVGDGKQKGKQEGEKQVVYIPGGGVREGAGPTSWFDEFTLEFA